MLQIFYLENVEEGTGDGTFVCRLPLLSKILTHYSALVKNFKFLEEVKILSKFFQNKFTCLM
ncbi:MAG: hypothetical protein A3I73_00390 [Omnitrophica bacterium RIFCSPLOWO2_02_FULL_45_16]|nr:MAG: hypothetical protein A3G36_00950 [Omnitrophica bacterium RIFCSPLOWO2_12_FULL_45_13]OGW94609.1 MAG: hypothetical protein A3K16_03585 [Omnitrophica bacterium RIFCSPLOWO2_01_FULL_45_24]OGX00017.1 MAG: hypothetical protein A3I73_00390 [Omnitrophica bacterium RIFCSPLOWO2_02_FULL_45_16]